MDYDDDNDFAEVPVGYRIVGEEDTDEELDEDIFPKKKTDEDDEDEFDFDDTPLEDDMESELY